MASIAKTFQRPFPWTILVIALLILSVAVISALFATGTISGMTGTSEVADTSRQTTPFTAPAAQAQTTQATLQQNSSAPQKVSLAQLTDSPEAKHAINALRMTIHWSHLFTNRDIAEKAFTCQTQLSRAVGGASTITRTIVGGAIDNGQIQSIVYHVTVDNTSFMTSRGYVPIKRADAKTTVRFSHTTGKMLVSGVSC